MGRREEVWFGKDSLRGGRGGGGVDNKEGCGGKEIKITQGGLKFCSETKYI
jgi:hypothetical protein